MYAPGLMNNACFPHRCQERSDSSSATRCPHGAQNALHLFFLNWVYFTCVLFQRWLIAHRLSAVRNWRTLVRVSGSCLLSVSFWWHDDFLQLGVQMGPPPSRREVITTDASLSGGRGGHMATSVGERSVGTVPMKVPYQHSEATGSYSDV